MLKTLFVAVLAVLAFHQTARADLVERDCKGRTKSGKKIEASFELFSDSGHITIDAKGYQVDFQKETHKGLKYRSDEHGGLKIKVDFRGRYAKGESAKLGEFTLKCRLPHSRDDDDSDGNIDEAELWFSGDTDT